MRPLEYRQVGPGVLSLRALDRHSCEKIIEEAQPGDWTQAEITNYDDKGMLAQHIDLKARNVQVKGPAKIPDLCRSFSKVLAERGLPVIQMHWGISGLRLSGPQLAKYAPGSHIRAHNDTATEFSSRCVSALLYLNEEYEGGKLLFPRLDLAHKPSVGELVLFPSEYLHAVTPVVSGVRYCFVGFYLAEAFGNWVEKMHR
jgi:predicted 2-oxoglutarate/Fe(II)-dependent dioxygenase YbiX